MKTYLVFLALLAIPSTQLKAQIPNASFENWTTTGGYASPVGWDNFNATTHVSGVYTCERGTTNPPHGTAFLMLITKMIGTSTVPGLAMSGKYDAVNMEPESGFPFTGRPQMLTGKWQYMSNGANIGRIAVYLTKWNNTTKKTDLIGSVEHDLTGSVTTWTSFSIPITYVSGETPDSAIIGLASSNKNATAGSYLYIDSLNFYGTVVGISTVNHAKYNVILSPNPARDNVSVDLGITMAENVVVRMIDMYGRIVKEETLAPGKRMYSIDLNAIPQGLYFVTVQAGEEVQTRQLLVQ